MAKYIDKDEAIRQLQKYADELVYNDNLYDKGRRIGLNRSIVTVKAVPAADVQPIRCGRWSECYTDTYHYSGICSACGRASIKSKTESLYAYCPKCGARMDGEKK